MRDRGVRDYVAAVEIVVVESVYHDDYNFDNLCVRDIFGRLEHRRKGYQESARIRSGLLEACKSVGYLGHPAMSAVRA